MIEGRMMRAVAWNGHQRSATPVFRPESEQAAREAVLALIVLQPARGTSAASVHDSDLHLITLT